MGDRRGTPHSRWLAGLAALAIAIGSSIALDRLAATGGPQAARVFPGAEWERVKDSRTAGYCQDRLDVATARVKALPTTAMVVIVGGRVLWEYGDLARVSYLASVRKSILAMLYGNYVQSGRIRLEKTMADLKIDDVEGLLPGEKAATIADLLAARSGVYHPAANAACAGCGSTAGDPPGPRGSVAHGTVLPLQQLGLQRARDDLRAGNRHEYLRCVRARPGEARGIAGLRSSRPAEERKPACVAPRRVSLLSLHARHGTHRLHHAARWRVVRDAARATRLGSTDDHARDSRRGHESGVVPERTLRYGYLWWIWDGPFNTGPYKSGYTGIGAVGQFITVLPELDMVVAHKTEPRPGGASVSRPDYLSVIDAVIAARCAS